MSVGSSSMTPSWNRNPKSDRVEATFRARVVSEYSLPLKVENVRRDFLWADRPPVYGVSVLVGRLPEEVLELARVAAVG